MDYIDLAKNFLGVKEGSAQHNYIINYYNDNVRPLPRGYKVKLTDSWCATFVSFIMFKCNAINAPYECSAQKMKELAIKKGLYHRGNPKPNDIIFYSWSNNNSICNHVGFVNHVWARDLETIEGNKDDKVGIRRVNKNSTTILGYATVPHKKDKTPLNTDKPDYNKIANDVIKGKYGNGSERKKKLKQLGYDYDLVQQTVNKIVLSKKTKK